MDTRYSNSPTTASSPASSGIEEDSGPESSSFGPGDDLPSPDTLTYPTFPANPPMFPTTRYFHLVEGLVKTPSWIVHPQDLASCLKAGCYIYREPGRANHNDRLLLHRLMCEVVGSAFSKCCEERCLTRWDDRTQSDILWAAKELCQLTCARLKVFKEKPSTTMEQVLEAEDELSHLLSAMGLIFDPNCVFHTHNRDKPLPSDNGHKLQPQNWARTVGASALGAESRADSVDEICEDRNLWLVNLINVFGEGDGFHLLAHFLSQETTVTYFLLDWMIHPLAKVVQFLQPDTCALLEEPIKSVLRRIQTVLETNVEQLSEGRDRVFAATSNILGKAYTILSVCEGPASADATVGQVQRTFVLKLLGFNKFDRQLVAVREINALLKRSMEVHKYDEGGSMQINIAWLKSHDIVKQLLKSNLHQKQYVDQVQKVLKQLTVEGSLQADHVELLCNLTEKADQSVSVKDNVYAMLNHLAQDFTIDQLDLMFNKFEGSPVSLLADALKVVQLTRNLAKSDTKGVNADRVISLLWKMGMHPNALVEVQKELPIVLCSYAETELGQSTLAYYVGKCIEQLQRGENAGIAISMLASLVEAVASTAVDAAEAVAGLDEEFHLLDTVTSSLEAHQHSFYRQMYESRQAAAGSNLGHFEDAKIDVEQHNKIVWGHLDFCAHLTRKMKSSLSIPHCERIWDSLVSPGGLLQGTLDQDERMCFEFFLNAVNQFMDIPAAEHVLMTELTKYPATRVDMCAWRTIWMFIQQVAMAEGKLVKEVDSDYDVPMLSPGKNKPLVTASLDIKGLPYAWMVALDSSDPTVAIDVQFRLVSLYTKLTSPLLEEAHMHRENMLSTCVKYLFEAAHIILGIPADPATWSTHVPHVIPPGLPDAMHLAASQRATRCLHLLSDMVVKCQGDTVPSRPVHAASSRGDVITLDLTGVLNQGHTDGRLRVTTHSNAFVGQLRRLVADKVKSEAPYVRMFCSGKELKGDAKLLCNARVTSGHMMVNVSSVRNSYSDPSPEARALAEALSPSLLLSQRPGFVDLLLCLADFALSPQPRAAAQELLDMLPTDLAVLSNIRAACMSDAPAARFAELLGCAGPGGASAARPARLMYTLQALISLLFPPDDVGRGASDAANEAEQLQHLFVSGGCIFVTLEALKLNVPQLASRDPVSVIRLCKTSLNLIDGLSHLFVPSAEGLAHHNVHPATGQRAGSLDHTWADDQPDSADSMSIEAGPSTSETSTGRPDAPPAPIPMAGDTGDSRPANVDTVNNVMLYYVMLAHEAGRGWGRELKSTAGAHSLVPDPDSQLSLEALKSLEALLEQHPQRLRHLLQDAATREMAIDGILSPQHETVRSNMSRFLKWVSTQPFGHSWLLSTLRTAMPRADSAPRHTRTYYSLFCDTVKGIPKMRSEEEQQRATQAAREILHAMVAASSTLWEEDDSDGCLEGKLQLLLALVQVLKASDVGTSHGGGLVKCLLTECLFPEAWLELALGHAASKASLDMTSLPLSDLQIIMGARSKTKETRKAALELLFELMISNLENLREGITLIQRLHINSPFVRQLADAFAYQPNRDLRPRHKFVGLKNPSATCYMNAVFQQLFMQPSIRHMVLMAPENAIEDKDNVFQQLQRTFCGLAYSNTEYFIPHGFWHAFKDYDGEPLNVREHQDAYEFFTRLQDCVDQHMRDAGVRPAMQAVMGGKIEQKIDCRSINYQSARDEEFYQLSLEVRGKKNLQESLDLYVSSELMEGDNQYLCEEQGKKVDATKRNCIKALPHMLVIQLKRFEFDYETMSRWKIKDRFEFPVQLDMYKYTVEGLAAREAAGRSASETGGETPTSPKAPPEERAKYMYDLKGVVVHSGTAFAGHYYSYIQDREGRIGLREPGQWYVFDDTSVDTWDISQLDPDCFGGKCANDLFGDQELFERPHSAYMLFYERDSSLEPIRQAQQQAANQAKPAEAEHVATSLKPASTDVLMSPGAILPDAPPLAETAGEEQKEDVTMAPSEPAASDMLMSPTDHRPDTSPSQPQIQASDVISSLAAVPVPNITLSVPSIYQDQMEMNLRVIQEAHVWGPEYFRFLRRLVESHTHALAPKLRRTSPTRSTTSTGSGHQRSGEDRSGSLASQWRNEESQQLGRGLMSLAMQFLIKAYLHAHVSLRDDMKEWANAICALMEANPAMPRLVLAMLTGKMPSDDDTDDDDVVELVPTDCMKLLFYCDGDDVRRTVAYIMITALQLVVKNDSGDDAGGAMSKSRNHESADAESIKTTLEVLRTWLGLRRLLSIPTKVYTDAFFMVMKAFVNLGPKQRTQLHDMGFVPLLAAAAHKYADMLARNYAGSDIYEQALIGVLSVLSPLVRRWDINPMLSTEDRSVLPNPYRMMEDPPLVLRGTEVLDALTSETMIAAYLEPSVLHSVEARRLLQFLTFDCRPPSLVFLAEFSRYLRKPNPATWYSMEEDVVAVCSLPDRWQLHRVEAVLYGTGAGSYGLFNVISRPSSELSRYVALKLLIKLVMAHPELKQKVTVTDRLPPWTELYSWLVHGGPFREGSRNLAPDPDLGAMLDAITVMHTPPGWNGGDEAADGSSVGTPSPDGSPAR